jgi:hypothetical protein
MLCSHGYAVLSPAMLAVTCRPQERIAAAMREDAEGREAAMRSRASRFALGRQRYFDTLGAPAAPDPYEGLRPGCVSAELAEALGESVFHRLHVHTCLLQYYLVVGVWFMLSSVYPYQYLGVFFSCMSGLWLVPRGYLPAAQLPHGMVMWLYGVCAWLQFVV